MTKDNNFKEILNKKPMLGLMYMFRMGIITTLIILLCALAFYGGAMYGCYSGDGSLDGLKCIEPKVIDACSDVMGNVYKIPEEYQESNSTFPEGYIWVD